MPFWTFPPTSYALQRSVGESLPEPVPMKTRRVWNDSDLNPVELKVRGIHVLNQVAIPDAGISREEGSFETVTVHRRTEAGFEAVRVDTFDAGARGRELVVSRDVFDASLINAFAEHEQGQSQAERSQAFTDERPPEQVQQDYGATVTENDWTQVSAIPAAQRAAELAAQAQAAYDAGQVGSAATVNPTQPSYSPSLPSTPAPVESPGFYPGSHIPLPPAYGGNVNDPIFGELGGSLGF